MRFFRGAHAAPALCLLALTMAGAVAAAENSIILQSTTSTRNSGLFDHILPLFETRTGIKVKVVAVGTGHALKNARNGDADVLLVHDKQAEEDFVAQGWGVRRFNVMFNDFVIVGPKADPAGIGGMTDAPAALRAIAAAKAGFASRGDSSGTHKAELRLWAVSQTGAGVLTGTWYLSTGSGMGATLNLASGRSAYALTDRATWISFKNKGDLKLLVEGDKRLFNQYGVILVNPARHRHVKSAQGRAFIGWLLSRDGQAAIAGYAVNGRQLFFPNGERVSSE